MGITGLGSQVKGVDEMPPALLDHDNHSSKVNGARKGHYDSFLSSLSISLNLTLLSSLYMIVK